MKHEMVKRRVLFVYGTRPEAIKMAPVIKAMAKSPWLQPVIAVTGQHRAMLDQVNALFGISPDYDLNILTARQGLEHVTCRALEGVADVVANERPQAVIVQGDTTTCFAGALAGFYARVPVIHLEAGLRTWDRSNPFPEEVNRCLTTQLSTLHLAPTATSRDNLLREGINPDTIIVTGNTVIDALNLAVDAATPICNPDVASMTTRRSVLITSHRRESLGEPMRQTANAIAQLARRFPDVLFILPAHLNPAVREVLLPPLEGIVNICVTEPLVYSDFVQAMRHCTLVLTDSGGVQEEAPAFGKPVLVLRETTERPEAVEAGTVKLVGTDQSRIVEAVSELLCDPVAYNTMAQTVNPYGDGRASQRAIQAVEHMFGLAGRPMAFHPTNADTRAPLALAG
jgi:UDP-N-acetylglucosamine 2-epimerase (non-hydrolysing)